MIFFSFTDKEIDFKLNKQCTPHFHMLTCPEWICKHKLTWMKLIYFFSSIIFLPLFSVKMQIPSFHLWFNRCLFAYILWTDNLMNMIKCWFLCQHVYFFKWEMSKRCCFTCTRFISRLCFQAHFSWKFVENIFHKKWSLQYIIHIYWILRY